MSDIRAEITRIIDETVKVRHSTFGNVTFLHLHRAAEAIEALFVRKALSSALEGFADDYMTSEKHHPGYVLIPVEKFERIRAALESEHPGPATPSTPPPHRMQG